MKSLTILLHVVAWVSGPGLALASSSPSPLIVRDHAGGFRAETTTRALEVGPELQLRVFLKKDARWTTLSPQGGLPPGADLETFFRDSLLLVAEPLPNTGGLK